MTVPQVQIQINQTALNNLANIWKLVINISALKKSLNETIINSSVTNMLASESFWVESIAKSFIDYNYFLALTIGFIFWRYLGDIPLALGGTCMVMLVINALLLPFMYGEQIINFLVLYGLGFIASLAWVAYRKIRGEER